MDEKAGIELDKRIEEITKTVVDPAGRSIPVIFEAETLEIADWHDCTLGDVYTRAMEKCIWPMRYIRNQVSIGIEDQIILSRSRVFVAGAGGLGGYALQLLARVGVGHLTVIDHGRFDESNLNRQILADTSDIGSHKASVAKIRLNAVNPAVNIESRHLSIDADNVLNLVDGSHLAIDALDNMDTRLVMHNACRKLKIPFVHGAISGFEGRLISLFPDDRDLATLFDRGEEISSEAVLGTPAITPAVIASLQAMEALKILLKRGRAFQGRMLYTDLESGGFDFFSF